MFSIFKRIIKQGRVTKEYPLKTGKAPKRLRGILQVADDCNACMICAQSCPTKAIALQSSKIAIDYGKCIFCGKCVQTCPTKVIKHTQQYTIARFNRENLISSRLDDAALKEAINQKIKKLFGRSLQIRHLDAGSCNGCDWEMTAMTNPVHDLQRLGIDIVASPRHADILLVTGAVSKNLAQAVRLTYEATPHPKMVMAVGTCAIDGGVFKDSSEVLNGADKVIPVDIYVPGCPPRPQAILYGLLKLIDRIPTE